jgi:plastocyanin
MRTMLAAMSALLIVTAVTIVQASSPPLARAAEHSVTVADISFTPATLNITAGDTVTWTLSSGTHTVVADDGSFSSGILDASGFSHTFNTPGTYEYFCSVHSTADLNLMNGVIHVAAAQAQPTNTPAPQPTNTPQPEPTDTPAADATDTPAATLTPAAEMEPTAVDAVPIAAPAGDAPSGGAAAGSGLPATGTGPTDTGAGTQWGMLVSAGMAVLGAVALGIHLRRRQGA